MKSSFVLPRIVVLAVAMTSAAGAAQQSGQRGSASAAPVEIAEWRVPWEKSRPRDPYMDATGRVWFVGQAGNYVAYLDPTTGRFKRYEVPAGTYPHNLIVDGDGYVWFAGNAAGYIGRLD